MQFYLFFSCNFWLNLFTKFLSIEFLMQKINTVSAYMQTTIIIFNISIFLLYILVFPNTQNITKIKSINVTIVAKTNL